MPPRPLTRLRKLALALPEATEKEAWGTPTFRVRDKMFAMYAAADTHVGGGRPGVWIKAAPGNQRLMVEMLPHKFFVPPYMGPSGWVGVWLDDPCDWAELAELLNDGWRLVAPKRLVAATEAAATEAAGPNATARGARPESSAPRTPAPRAARARPSAGRPPARKGGRSR